MSNSLWPHEWQHIRLPCSSLSPRVYTCPLSQWCQPTISSSVAPFSSSPKSFQHQGLFQWIRSWYQVAKVLELQLQHQFFQRVFRVDFLEDWLAWSPCHPRDSQWCRTSALGFLDGLRVKTPPPSAGDMGSTPDPGRPHVLRCSSAREPPLLRPHGTAAETQEPSSPCSATRQGTTMRSPRTTAGEQCWLAAAEKACKQWRPSTAWRNKNLSPRGPWSRDYTPATRLPGDMKLSWSYHLLLLSAILGLGSPLTTTGLMSTWNVSPSTWGPLTHPPSP